MNGALTVCLFTVAAAWQSATLQWWRNRRPGFELFTSQLVLDEATAGHPEAAERRLRSLADMPVPKYALRWN